MKRDITKATPSSPLEYLIASQSAVGSGTLSVTVLTRDPNPARSAKVEYYILGRYHQVRAKAADH